MAVLRVLALAGLLLCLACSSASAADQTFYPGSVFEQRWTSDYQWGGKPARLRFTLAASMYISRYDKLFVVSQYGGTGQVGSISQGLRPYMMRGAVSREAFENFPQAEGLWSAQKSPKKATVLAQGAGPSTGQRWGEITYKSDFGEQLTWLVFVNRRFNGKKKRNFWGFALAAEQGFWPSRQDAHKFAASVHLGE